MSAFEGTSSPPQCGRHKWKPPCRFRCRSRSTSKKPKQVWSVQFGIGPEAAAGRRAGLRQAGPAADVPSLPSPPVSSSPPSSEFRFSQHQEIPGAPAELGPEIKFVFHAMPWLAGIGDNPVQVDSVSPFRLRDRDQLIYTVLGDDTELNTGNGVTLMVERHFYSRRCPEPRVIPFPVFNPAL